jgi:hypothetical protein
MNNGLQRGLVVHLSLKNTSNKTKPASLKAPIIQYHALNKHKKTASEGDHQFP